MGGSLLPQRGGGAEVAEFDQSWILILYALGLFAPLR